MMPREKTRRLSGESRASRVPAHQTIAWCRARDFQALSLKLKSTILEPIPQPSGGDHVVPVVDEHLVARLLRYLGHALADLSENVPAEDELLAALDQWPGASGLGKPLKSNLHGSKFLPI